MRARGYAPGECIAVGDSREDLGVAEVVGRFFLVANGPDVTGPNVTRTESGHGDGFYEAVVSLSAWDNRPDGHRERWPTALRRTAPPGGRAVGCGPRRLPGHAGRAGDAGGATTASAWRCSSWADRGRHRARASARSTPTWTPAGATRPRRVGVWVSHQYLLSGRASAARGWLARAERAVPGRRVRGPGLGRHRAGAPRREPGGAGGPRAPGDGDRARRPATATWRSYALSLLGLTEVSAGQLEPAGCSCSRRPWRRRRPAGSATCTRWPRPTAT